MQDLSIIRKQNQQAGLSEVPTLVEQGKHVVVVHHGLNYSGHKAFDSRGEADAYASTQSAEIGASVKTYSPQAVAA